MKRTLFFITVFAGLGLSPLVAQTTAKKPAASVKEAVTDAAKEATEVAKPAKPTRATTAKAAEKPKIAAPKSPRKPADKAVLAKAKEQADKLKPEEKAKLLAVVQKGKLEEVDALPGIGEGIGGHIIAARPISSVEDLVNVTGIAEDRYSGLLAWAQGKAAPAKTRAAKPAAPTRATAKDAAGKAAKDAATDAAGKAAKGAAGDALKGVKPPAVPKP